MESLKETNTLDPCFANSRKCYLGRIYNGGETNLQIGFLHDGGLEPVSQSSTEFLESVISTCTEILRNVWREIDYSSRLCSKFRVDLDAELREI
ncbi:hypothetical protein AVEN_237667-1 [Araneus ventricosus]|uniref:Uncharacterized protein n=1 Tax=Araneus ventricosus TaxID=182803 RepID=A0A4Y2KBN6_ARAVE|nr:hypothetical protein AVEN_237667-1 [Araneus ventricosus]